MQAQTAHSSAQPTRSLTTPPGRVLPTKDGRVIPPEFEFLNKGSGNNELRNNIDNWRQFEFDLLELFLVAGFGGTFKCSFKSHTKGNQHTKGLRVKCPTTAGIEMAVHYGSNDSVVLMHISCPTDVRDPLKFFQYMTYAQRVLREEEDEATQKRRHQFGERGIPEFGKFRRVVPHPVFTKPVSTPPAALLAPPGATPRIEKPEVVPRAAPFYKDMTMLALFMSELEKHATQDGMVTRTNCIDILMKEFSIKGVSTGAVLRGIIGDGHLFEATSGDELLRFGEMWLTAWLNKSRTANSVAPTVPEGGTISIGDLLSIDKLTDEAQRLRLRREELESSLGVLQPKATQMKAELLVLEPKVARMKSELEGLETQATSSQRELDEILAELRDPKYAKAEGDLTLLQKLLGKKI